MDYYIQKLEFFVAIVVPQQIPAGWIGTWVSLISQTLFFGSLTMYNFI
jgi:hypothetical protein